MGQKGISKSKFMGKKMTFEQTDDLRMDMGALFFAIAKRLPRILIVTAILLVATYFILQIVPKKYVSSASILVESRESVFTRATNDNSSSSASIVDPTVIASHAALIKSRDTIARVVENEGLRDIAELNGSKKSFFQDVFSLFSKPISTQSQNERVILAVAKRTKVIQLPASRVITIFFRSTDPHLSARVANALANTHVTRRTELSVSDTSNASQWLLVEIEKMRGLVATAEKAVANYRVDNDLFVGTNNTSILDLQLSNISTQITTAQERKNQAESRVALIRGLLKSGRPVDGVPDVRNSIVVQRLAQDKAKLQGDLALLSATRLPNHPEVMALSAQIAEIDKQIIREGRQVANALEAEAKIESDLVQSLRDDLTRLKIDVSGATKSNVDLIGLEREAKAQRDLLSIYLMRYRDAAARAGNSGVLPDVRVITSAAPSIVPASPKKGFILLAVGIIALTFQFGGVLFSELLSGRAIRDVHNNRENGQEGTYASDENINKEEEFQSMSMAQNSNNLGLKEVEQPLNTATYMDVTLFSKQIARSNPLMFVTNLNSNKDGSTQAISSELISAGNSVIEVDAGSRRVSSNLGISDLSFDNVEFGDVVQRRAQSNFAFVPWGQKNTLNLNSPKANTLITALGEIFETVIVDVGRAGMASSLSAFTGLNGLVLLVVDDGVEQREIDSVSRDISDLGFSNIRILSSSSHQSKVA